MSSLLQTLFFTTEKDPMSFSVLYLLPSVSRKVLDDGEWLLVACRFTEEFPQSGSKLAPIENVGSVSQFRT